MAAGYQSVLDYQTRLLKLERVHRLVDSSSPTFDVDQLSPREEELVLALSLPRRAVEERPIQQLDNSASSEKDLNEENGPSITASDGALETGLIADDDCDDDKIVEVIELSSDSSASDNDDDHDDNDDDDVEILEAPLQKQDPSPSPKQVPSLKRGPSVRPPRASKRKALERIKEDAEQHASASEKTVAPSPAPPPPASPLPPLPQPAPPTQPASPHTIAAQPASGLKVNESALTADGPKSSNKARAGVFAPTQNADSKWTPAFPSSSQPSGIRSSLIANTSLKPVALGSKANTGDGGPSVASKGADTTRLDKPVTRRIDPFNLPRPTQPLRLPRFLRLSELQSQKTASESSAARSSSSKSVDADQGSGKTGAIQPHKKKEPRQQQQDPAAPKGSTSRSTAGSSASGPNAWAKTLSRRLGDGPNLSEHDLKSGRAEKVTAGSAAGQQPGQHVEPVSSKQGDKVDQVRTRAAACTESEVYMSDPVYTTSAAHSACGGIVDRHSRALCERRPSSPPPSATETGLWRPAASGR